LCKPLDDDDDDGDNYDDLVDVVRLPIPQVIYEHGEPWLNEKGKPPDSSTRAL
jgi:hypothetical protein